MTNFVKNATVTGILNVTEVYLVPLVNPDGREVNKRWNDNGIDLNRNFDVDFGRLIGRSMCIGKLFGRIKIPIIQIPFVGTFTNSGRHPFSEPESQALRYLMKALNYHDFSFYVNCHTASHNFMGPWGAPKPPFEMTSREKNVIGQVFDWVEENTEYEAYRGKGSTSGMVMDWCFKEFRIPSFIFEILSVEYGSYYGEGEHDHLVHWMKTTLPIFVYLLVNIEDFHDWRSPDVCPPLPEGVPPTPLI